MAARTRTFRTALLGSAVSLGAGVAVAFTPGEAGAAADPFCTTTWSGGNGAWEDPTRWSGGTAPTADDYVCVLAPAAGPAPTVTLRGSPSVRGTTVVGGVLRLGASAHLTSVVLDLTRSTVAGPGQLTSTSFGVVTITGSRLVAGVHLAVQGSLRLRGTVGLGGGSHLERQGFGGLTDLDPGLAVRALDADPGNHLTITGLPVEVTGTVTIGVPLRLRNVAVRVSGALMVPRLDALGADGRLANPAADGSAILGAFPGGRITLARSITAIGPGVLLEAGDLRTVDGDRDPLLDLVRVDGALSLDRPLTLDHALEVTGGLRTTNALRVPLLTVRSGGTLTARSSVPAAAAIDAPTVRVEQGASVSATSVSGRLVALGETSLAGAHVGRLTLGGATTSATFHDTPATVDGAAQLGGALQVVLPKPNQRVPTGTRYVLLTAAGGITGTFASVTGTPERRGSIALEYEPNRVIGVFTAPG